MLPQKKKIVICKSYIIPKASSAPNGSIEEKLKSLGKCPNTAKKKKKKKKISVPVKVWQKYLNPGF